MRSCSANRWVRAATSGVVTVERDQPYIVVGTKVEDLVLGKVCPEVLDDPVVVAERHRRHGGRQPVTVSGDGGDDRNAAPSSTRVRSQITDDSLDDGGGAVLLPDRNLAGLPGLPDFVHRWDEQGLNDLDDRRPFVDEPPSESANGDLVALKQVGPHPFGGPFKPTSARCGRSTGGVADGFEGVELRDIDRVATADQRCWEAPCPHPPVGGLIVDAQSVGGLLEVEMLVCERHERQSTPRRQHWALMATK